MGAACSINRAPPDVGSDDDHEPTIVTNTAQDEALAAALGRQQSPTDFGITALKMSLIMKRRVEALRMRRIGRSRTALTKTSLKNIEGRLSHAKEEGSDGEGRLSYTSAEGSTVADSAVAEPPRRKINRHVVRDGETLLDQRLSFAGLEQEIMRGDGNCQFRSLSFQMFETQELHAHVRKRVCAYMLSKRDDYAIYFEEGEFDQYVGRMSMLCTWGDELTLRAAADCFGCIIHVVTSTVENWHLKYDPEGQPACKRLFLTYISPVHYNSIVRAVKPAAPAAAEKA